MKVFLINLQNDILQLIPWSFIINFILPYQFRDFIAEEIRKSRMGEICKKKINIEWKPIQSSSKKTGLQKVREKDR